MGYYTNFDLSVNDSLNREIEIIKDFRTNNENAEYAFDEEGRCNSECKWYKHENELKEFSVKYPDTLFVLSGEGEDYGDLWRLYVKNGKSHRSKAEIVFPDFDLNVLI